MKLSFLDSSFLNISVFSIFEPDPSLPVSMANGSTGQIAVPTVIALMCEPYMHPLQLPSVKTVGEGRAIIMHGGKMLNAKWKRGSNLDPFHIVDSNGNTLFIPKGKPWISLVPNTFSPTFDN